MAKELKPINTAALKIIAADDSDDAITYVNELLTTSDKPSTNENYWFPTSENPGDPAKNTPIQRPVLREISLKIYKNWNHSISQIFQMGRLTTQGKKERHRRDPNRISRHLCQTQPGHRDQSRHQNKTHTKNRRTR